MLTASNMQDAWMARLGRGAVYAGLATPLVVMLPVLFPYTYGKGVYFSVVAALAWFAVIAGGVSDALRLSRHWLVFAVPAVFAVFIALSFGGVDIGRSFWGTIERAEGMAYYAGLAGYFLAAAAYLRTEAAWYRFSVILIGVNMAVAFFALAQAAGVDLAINESSGRVGGTLGNAAFLASYLVLSLSFLGFAACRFPDLQRYAWGAVAFDIATIVLSATRGAILALAVAGVTCALGIILQKHQASRMARRTAFAVLLAMAVIVTGLWVARDTAAVRDIEALRRLTGIGWEDTTVKNRVLMWGYSWRAFQERPLSGWGLENFNRGFNYVYDSRISEEWFDRAHNAYLDVLVTTGIFGFVAYVALLAGMAGAIWLLWRRGQIDMPTAYLLGGGFGAYLLQNAFIFDTVSTMHLFVIFAVLLIYLTPQPAIKGGCVVRPAAARAVMTLAAVVAVGWLGWGVVRPATAMTYGSTALAAMSYGDESAMAALDRALESDTHGTAELLHQAAMTAVDQAHVDELRFLDEMIVRLEPHALSDIRLALQLAQLYNFKATADPAYAEKTIALMEAQLPENAGRQEVWYHRGRAYALQGEQERALEAFEKALALNPDRDAYWNLVSTLAYFRDFEASEARLREALRHPAATLSTEELQTLVRTYLYFGFEPGVETAAQAVAQRTDDADYYLILAKHYERIGDDARAWEYLQAAMDRNPEVRASYEAEVRKQLEGAQ